MGKCKMCGQQLPEMNVRYGDVKKIHIDLHEEYGGVYVWDNGDYLHINAALETEVDIAVRR